MATSFPMSSPWVDLEALNAAKLSARTTTPINDLYALLAPLITDSGWQNMASLSLGWTNDSTVPQARRVGNVVYLVGGVVNATYNSTSYATACVLPATVPLPPGTRVLSLPAAGTAARSARLLSDGSVQMATSATSSVAFRLDGLYYLIN